MILSKISVLWEKQYPGYAVLEESPDWKEAKTARNRRCFNRPSAITLLLLVGAFSLSITSFLVGRHSSRDRFVEVIECKYFKRLPISPAMLTQSTRSGNSISRFQIQ